MKNINLKKALSMIAVVFSLIILQSTAIFACDIDFKVTDNNKSSYEIGDVVVIKLSVALTHRHCHVDIEKTQINSNGLEVMGATKWTEKTSGLWERKVKVKVTKKGKVSLSAVRTCDKEGGQGSITLKAQ